MKRFIKQLFCKHVYKGIDREILYWRRELDGGTDWITGYIPTYSNYVYSALTEKCLKCDKIIVSKVSQNIGNQIPEDVENR